jgi:hypothetical protein
MPSLASGIGMKRRVTRTGKATMARRRKAVSSKRKAAAAVARHSRASDADLKQQLDQRTRDLAESQRLLAEALEQQTAASEVLKLISSSPGELETVFRTILNKATRICEVKFANLFHFDGDKFHFAAEFGTPPEHADFQRRRGPFPARAGSPLAFLVGKKQVVICKDLLEPTSAVGEDSSVFTLAGDIRPVFGGRPQDQSECDFPHFKVADD